MLVGPRPIEGAEPQDRRVNLHRPSEVLDQVLCSLLRGPIDRAAPREHVHTAGMHEASGAICCCSFKNRQRAQHVHLDCLTRQVACSVKVSYRCAMEYRFAPGHRRPHRICITHVGNNNFTVDCFRSLQVEHYHRMAATYQLVSDVASQETTTPGHQHPSQFLPRHQTLTHPWQGDSDCRCRSRCFVRRVE